MKKLQILSTMATKVTNLTGRTGLKIGKYSPEILVVGGVVGIVTSTILACTATLKLESIIDTAQDTITKIHSHEGIDEDKYSLKDANHDLFITYIQTGIKIGKLYLPAVTLGLLSIGSVLCSYRILSRRNVALMAAYKGVEEAFAKYRGRVITDVGVDKDREYKYGVRKEKIDTIITNEDGTTKKGKETIDIIDKDHSVYARFFDELSNNWSKTPEYNLLFLKSQQQYCNDLLHSRGHIFLNEVYDMLDIPRTQAGSIVGWVKGAGDDFVDFGMFDLAYAGSRDFVNGYEKAILLDFNVDGVIYDKIWDLDSLNAKGCGNFYQDVIDYPDIYTFDRGFYDFDIYNLCKR